MPTYEADLEWLRQIHPHEYAKIPQEILLNSNYKQQHMSLIEETTGAEFWVIAFFAYNDAYNDEPPAVELPDVFVELGIERPPADESVVICPSHTLEVSRAICSRCRPLDNSLSV